MLQRLRATLNVFGRGSATASGSGGRVLETPWSQPPEAVLAALEVDAARGLAAAVARQRFARYGPNRLRRVESRSAWLVLAVQFKSLMMALLAAAAFLAFAMSRPIDFAAIVIVMALNVVIGFVVELRGVRSMEALYRLVQVRTRVRRDGRVQEIPADRLVPGDIVVLEGGDIVSADLRLIEAASLQADESALTGESVPVDKAVEACAAQAKPAERSPMLHSGTAVTRGTAEGVVVGTAANTELGRIASLVAQAKDQTTPLELRLERLGRRLIWATLAMAISLTAAGMLLGRDPGLMLEISIALAVAAVPEGLPVVATIALARGMLHMAKHNALISRLSAVETLGATGVICTDKTGTLTENRMTVTRLVLAGGDDMALGANQETAFTCAGRPVDPDAHPMLRRALEAAALCNNASLAEDGGAGIGDPLEVALLAAARHAGMRRDTLLQRWPEVRQEPFDTETRMMATFHAHEQGLRVAVKGAPESVLGACSRIACIDGAEPMTPQSREHWLSRNARLADQGLRVLALAGRDCTAGDIAPYEDLEFLGLVGLLDPPRADVRDAIAGCRSAGIRVVMITGDQPATARHVAQAVGLVDEGDAAVIHGDELGAAEAMSADERNRVLRAGVFARVDPAQKLDLIALHQGAGMVVAMTGDGVNDAPALRKADIGVAMGQRGTQVAREAADMVLKDDAFGTIVLAIRQGRVIFENIRAFVVYLMSCNLSEVIVVALATLAGAPLPLLPLQILYLNLITDVFPALALGVGPGNPRVMTLPPRPAIEPILTARHWLAVGGYGVLIAAAVLGAFAVALHGLAMAREAAVTVSFLTLALAQLWHVFNMRSPGSRLFDNGIVRNRYVWGALGLCTALLIMAVCLHGLSQVLRLVPLDTTGWALVLVASSVPLLIGQGVKAIRGLGHREAPACSAHSVSAS
jgi:Ca2+-transporting ATPase